MSDKQPEHKLAGSVGITTTEDGYVILIIPTRDWETKEESDHQIYKLSIPQSVEIARNLLTVSLDVLKRLFPPDAQHGKKPGKTH